MRTRNPCFYNARWLICQYAFLLSSVFLPACSRQNNSLNQPAENQIEISAAAININTASADELGKLPHIGEQTARQIVVYREKFGRFRQPAHLMFVRGISDRRFREMRNMVKVE